MFTSTSNSSNSNSFQPKFIFPSDLYNNCLVKLIYLSKCPPHHGACGKLSFHLMFTLVKNSLNSSVLITCFNHLAAPWNVLGNLLSQVGLVHQSSGNFLTGLPRLPKSVGFCLVGTYFQTINLCSKILLTRSATNTF